MEVQKLKLVYKGGGIRVRIACRARKLRLLGHLVIEAEKVLVLNNIAAIVEVECIGRRNKWKLLLDGASSVFGGALRNRLV